MMKQIIHAEVAEHCGSRRAAELLGVSMPTMTRIVQSGAITPIPMDGDGPLVFLVDDVLELRDRRKQAKP